MKIVPLKSVAHTTPKENFKFTAEAIPRIVPGRHKSGRTYSSPSIIYEGQKYTRLEEKIFIPRKTLLKRRTLEDDSFDEPEMTDQRVHLEVQEVSDEFEIEKSIIHGSNTAQGSTAYLSQSYRPASV